MAVDPVCKMNVVEKGATYTSVFEGRNFYFCSAACKQQFEKNPQKCGK
ncbi:MAG: YHS domain-containing protein [Candidatus Bathyarchaeia archaeon]